MLSLYGCQNDVFLQSCFLFSGDLNKDTKNDKIAQNEIRKVVHSMRSSRRPFLTTRQAFSNKWLKLQRTGGQGNALSFSQAKSIWGQKKDTNERENALRLNSNDYHYPKWYRCFLEAKLAGMPLIDNERPLPNSVDNRKDEMASDQQNEELDTIKK